MCATREIFFPYEGVGIKYYKNVNILGSRVRAAVKILLNY